MKKYSIILIISLLISAAFGIAAVFYYENEIISKILNLFSILFAGGTSISVAFNLNYTKTTLTSEIRQINNSLNKVDNGQNQVANQIINYYFGGPVYPKNGDFSALPNQANQDNGTALEVFNSYKENFKAMCDEWEKNNLEKIADKVKEKMDKENLRDLTRGEFLKKYLEEGRNVSDETIQDLWSNIFVYEIKHKNSIHLRTLEVIKNITAEEAQLFKKISPYIFCGLYFYECFSNDKPSLFDITKLADIGIFKQTYILTWNLKIDKNSSEQLSDEEFVLIIDNKFNAPVNISMPVYVLTDVGLQLYRSLNCKVSLDNIKQIARTIKKKYLDITVSLQKTASINGNEATTETEEIIDID